MIARSVNAAADVIHRAQVNGKQTAMGLAIALESAQMLQSPEQMAQAAQVEAERDALKAKVAELEAERRKYVGVEPTIAEEMAYLGRCLDAVYDLCDKTAAQGITSGGPFTVEAVRIAADGDRPAASRPALPWAHVMDDGDLHEFLGDLVSAAMGRWRSGPEVPDRTVLADIEKVCADWRTPGEGLRGDEPETADAVTQVFAPVASPREADVTPQVQKLRSLLAGQRAVLEDPHDSPLHHPYRLGHDLPETGAAGESA